MKKIFTTLSFAVLMLVANAQQQPLFSQYMQNPFIINPAVSGTLGYTELKTVIRSQWQSFEGGQRIKTFSINAPLYDNKIGVGAYAFSDVIGPVNRTGLNGAYSYHIITGKNEMLSFGISGLFYMYQLNTQDLKFDINNNTDMVLNKGNFRAFAPNAGFGMYYKTEKYYMGLSIPELMPVKITSSTDYSMITEKQHYFITGGYNLKASDAVTLVPSLMLKYVSGAPMQIDANVSVDIKKMVNLGASFRSGDALVFMLGYSYKDILQFGYAYDITMSNLKQYVGASHELMLCYKFKKKEAPKGDNEEQEEKKEEQPKQEEPK